MYNLSNLYNILHHIDGINIKGVNKNAIYTKIEKLRRKFSNDPAELNSDHCLIRPLSVSFLILV